MTTKHNKLPQITTVLFDLDDTLLNSLPARVEALEHVFKYAGISQFDARHDLQNLRGLEIKGILTRYGASQDKLDSLFIEYRRAYWATEHHPIDLYPGISSMLGKFHARDFKLGVVTQKGRDFTFEGYRAGAVVELEKMGILNLFSVVVGMEDVTKLKPDPEGINLALNKLQASPKETLFVGDSFADIAAAKAADCWSCYAKWGLPLEADKLDADFTMSTPEELMKFIFPQSTLLYW